MFDSWIPWTVTRQAPLSVKFSRQEYWRGLPFPLQEIFLTQGSNPCLLRLLYGRACLVTQSCLALCDPMDCSLLDFSVHGDCPGKNTRVGCHALLQGIFPTQGSNWGLCRRWILHSLSHQGRPYNNNRKSFTSYCDYDRCYCLSLTWINSLNPHTYPGFPAPRLPFLGLLTSTYGNQITLKSLKIITSYLLFRKKKS